MVTLTRTHTHIYIYMYMYTHTHTHTYIYIYVIYIINGLACLFSSWNTTFNATSGKGWVCLPCDPTLGKIDVE